jgi:hypothetical protein
VRDIACALQVLPESCAGSLGKVPGGEAARFPHVVHASPARQALEFRFAAGPGKFDTPPPKQPVQ